MTCCTVGKRADAPDIDSALRAGFGVRDVASRFGLGKSLLAEHRKACLGITGRLEAPPDAATRFPDKGPDSGRELSAGCPDRPRTTEGDSRARVISLRKSAREEGAGAADELSGLPPRPETVEGRVEVCMDLMARVVWRAETGDELAAAWGLSVSTIRDYSSEASRRLKSLRDPDEVRQMLTHSFAEGLRIAREDRDVRGLAAVGKAYGDIAGVTAPQRLEHTGAHGAPLGLPPRAAILLERARAGDDEAARLLRAWCGGDDDDAPGLPEMAGEVSP
jgi:hypothetical protein